MSKSKVLIAVDKSKSYRVHLTITTNIVEEARKLHGCSPLAIAGLGRTLTATGMMSLGLKGEGDRLTVLFKGDGPSKEILVTGYSNGDIKGYISNPNVDLPLNAEGKLDVGGSLGIGELTVIKDLGLKEPYVGTIALVSGEIADDLTAYYYISEQQNTSIALGVKVGRENNVIASGGMFIQMLPNPDEKAIDSLEKMIAEMKPITTVIEEVLLAGSGKSEEGLLTELMNKVFGCMSEEFKPEILEYKEIQLKCDCSKDRMERALMTIGRKEIEEILREDGQAELGCHFCGKTYLFSEEELINILK